MDAFKCDRCGEYGPAADKETLAGTVIRDTINLYLTADEFLFVPSKGVVGRSPPQRYIDSLDLCPGCADLLSLALKAWWTPGETMVTFESVEELVEGFGE